VATMLEMLAVGRAKERERRGLVRTFLRRGILGLISVW
jgi:hypothetical protein